MGKIDNSKPAMMIKYVRTNCTHGEDFYEREHQNPKDSEPDVMCLCTCTKFHIKYDEYEVNVICTECGTRFNIYN